MSGSPCDDRRSDGSPCGECVGCRIFYWLSTAQLCAAAAVLIIYSVLLPLILFAPSPEDGTYSLISACIVWVVAASLVYDSWRDCVRHTHPDDRKDKDR